MPQHALKGYVLADQTRGPALPGISVQGLGTFEVHCVNLALAMTYLAHAPASVVELGIPLNARYYEATLYEPLGRKGYIFEIVGTAATLADPPDAPRFIDRLYDNSPTTIIAWRRRVRGQGIPLYIEARWSPTTTTLDIDIRGVAQDRKLHYRAWAVTAITLLDETHGAQPAGRPSIKSRYYPPDTFRAAWPEKRAQAQRKRGNDDVRNEDMARAYGVSLSTYQRYLREYGRPPSPKILLPPNS